MCPASALIAAETGKRAPDSAFGNRVNGFHVPLFGTEARRVLTFAMRSRLTAYGRMMSRASNAKTGPDMKVSRATFREAAADWTAASGMMPAQSRMSPVISRGPRNSCRP